MSDANLLIMLCLLALVFWLCFRAIIAIIREIKRK